MTTHTIDQLRHAGLLQGSEPHLTDKGRNWLRALESVRSNEGSPRRGSSDEFLYLPDALEPTVPAGALGDDEDFVCSTSGLLR